jgi:CelD/BcsL family acetyltransferase involved in cellulose biosynthesis
MTLRATLVQPEDISPEHRERWSSFAAQPSFGSPFLSWSFAQAVGRLRDDARVAVFHEGRRTCGYLAFQVDGDGAGHPIGDTICDAQAVMAPSGWRFDPRGLIEAAGMSAWAFDHLTVAQPDFDPYHVHRHRCPVVELAAGYDSFLQDVRGHSKDLLAQVGRRRRKLEREVGPVVCEWQSTQPDEDLRSLHDWKSDQYRREGAWDRFAQQWIARAVEQLAGSRDPTCTGLLTSLRAGEHLVAVHFGLLGTDRLSWWFPAYDPDFGAYSPGLILLLDLIAESARRGVDRIDLGRGEHGYKLRVTSRAYEVAEGRVAASPTIAGSPLPSGSQSTGAAPITGEANRFGEWHQRHPEP